MRHAVYGELVEEEMEEVRRRVGRIEAGIRSRVAAVLRGEVIPAWAGDALWIGGAMTAVRRGSTPFLTRRKRSFGIA